MPAEIQDQLALRATSFKSVTVACATLHLYYTATHLDEEVKYIWSRKWTAGKIMYLLTRYLGTIFLMCSVIGVNTYFWNDTGLPGDLNNTKVDRTLKNFIPTCFYGGLFSGFGPMLILAAEVILQMRVYALYERDKRLLAFFILLTISLFGFNILQMSYLFLNVEANTCGVYGSCFDKRSTLRKAFIPHITLYRYTCLDALPISGIGWSVTALTEFLLFLLVIIKARKRLFKSRNRATIQDVSISMAKDSIAYFAVLFSVCLIGAVIIFVHEHVSSDFIFVLSVHKNSYVTIAITVMTILASKLITNLRAELYSPSDIGETHLCWNARVPELLSSYQDVGGSTDGDAG